MTDHELVVQLMNDVAALRQRVADLEAERGQARLRRWLSRSSGRRLALVLAVTGAAAVGSLSFAATTGCPDGLPVCFVPNTPALAGDLNMDLSTIKDWIETKVGTVGSANIKITGVTTSTNQVTIQTGSTSLAGIAAGTGKPLVVTGLITDGWTDKSVGVEIRHDNQTQGIGIGYSGVYVTGSNANQDLHLSARGTGEVIANGNFETTGELRGNTIRQRNCNWGPFGPGVGADNQTHQIFCPSGQFMAGWRCDATDRLDGNCSAYCCNP